MATLTKIPLSGSTDGRGILVTGTTATDGTTIHQTATSQTAAGQGDEITIIAYNSATGTETLTLSWGGTTSPNDMFKTDLPAGYGGPLTPGAMFLRNGLTIRAGSTTASKVTIFGSVIRAT